MMNATGNHHHAGTTPVKDEVHANCLIAAASSLTIFILSFHAVFCAMYRYSMLSFQRPAMQRIINLVRCSNLVLCSTALFIL
jgi:hypothetical protein